MKIYAVVEYNEETSSPVVISEAFLTEETATLAYKKKIEELCDLDPDRPLDESELNNVDIQARGAINIIDACGDSGNLITLFLISITI